MILTYPDHRTESFLLAPKERKVEEKPDTRKSICLTFFFWRYNPTDTFAGTPSTSIFTFNKEDHTIGNLLRARLLQNRHVLFAAYKVRAVDLSLQTARLIAHRMNQLGASPS